MNIKHNRNRFSKGSGGGVVDDACGLGVGGDLMLGIIVVVSSPVGMISVSVALPWLALTP